MGDRAAHSTDKPQRSAAVGGQGLRGSARSEFNPRAALKNPEWAGATV